jgi:hypothetical protein
VLVDGKLEWGRGSANWVPKDALRHGREWQRRLDRLPGGEIEAEQLGRGPSLDHQQRARMRAKRAYVVPDAGAPAQIRRGPRILVTTPAAAMSPPTDDTGTTYGPSAGAFSMTRSRPGLLASHR